MDSNAEVTKPDMTAQALARYSPSDAAIAKMQADYMPLVVSGEDDKAGCAIVRAARLDRKRWEAEFRDWAYDYPLSDLVNEPYYDKLRDAWMSSAEAEWRWKNGNA